MSQAAPSVDMLRLEILGLVGTGARLYTQKMHQMLQSKEGYLKAIFNKWKGPRVNGANGKKVDVMEMVQWRDMLMTAQLFDHDFNNREASLCFIHSRMKVIDQSKGMVRARSIDFADFCEAIARVADTKCLPPM
eukprot:gene4807-5875_t